MDERLRLLRNLILLGLPLIVLMAVAASFPMDYFTGEYPMWAQEKSFVLARGGGADGADSADGDDYGKAGSGSYESLIIGDSRAKSGLIPKELDHEGRTYNIAIGGATPIEMYYALRGYLETHESPKRAIIVFAPYHFCDIDNFDQTLYYNYLSLGQIAELEGKARIHAGSESVDYKGWLTDVISYKLRLPSKYLAAIYDALPNGNGKDNRARYNNIEAEYGHTLFGTEESNNGESYETHHETFDSSELVLYYFDRVLKVLEDNKTDVIIEQAPLNPYSSSHLYPEFTRGFYEYMSLIEAEHPSFTVVKEIPEYEAEYFGDNNHLNGAGALKFTQEIREKYYK